MIEIDHIFIFSNTNGRKADDLVSSGLAEGSNRIHKRQGTMNRKFYFENFFLEILWVYDQSERDKVGTKRIGLSQRANFKNNNSSRFGLCLVNDKATNTLFKGAQNYQPAYFPSGMSIDVISNSEYFGLPWTFRLPYQSDKPETNEPKNHLMKLSQLTKVKFGTNQKNLSSEFTSAFKGEQMVEFYEDVKSSLTLEFDFRKQQKTYRNEFLDLTIHY